MSNTMTAAWAWQDGQDAVTATWRLGGWPIDPAITDSLTWPCGSTSDRSVRSSCKKPAEWQVERRRGDHASTAWYCTRHLPSTEAPPRDAEQVS
ncbi:hypothetical protein AB0L04_22550 [Streptomyces glaucescens]|uniref:hypothetical protein n=1 Tax=Streptomyces glaucescens TaxID=1907 RepID=UPI00344BCD2E